MNTDDLHLLETFNAARLTLKGLKEKAAKHADDLILPQMVDDIPGAPAHAISEHLKKLEQLLDTYASHPAASYQQLVEHAQDAAAFEQRWQRWNLVREKVYETHRAAQKDFRSNALHMDVDTLVHSKDRVVLSLNAKHGIVGANQNGVFYQVELSEDHANSRVRTFHVVDHSAPSQALLLPERCFSHFEFTRRPLNSIQPVVKLVNYTVMLDVAILELETPPCKITDLSSLLRRRQYMTFKDLASLAIPLAAALVLLHRLNVVHGGVEPGSVWWCGDRFKIVDLAQMGKKNCFSAHLTCSTTCLHAKLYEKHHLQFSCDWQALGKLLLYVFAFPTRQHSELASDTFTTTKLEILLECVKHLEWEAALKELFSQKNAPQADLIKLAKDALSSTDIIFDLRKHDSTVS